THLVRWWWCPPNRSVAYRVDARASELGPEDARLSRPWPRPRPIVCCSFRAGVATRTVTSTVASRAAGGARLSGHVRARRMASAAKRALTEQRRTNVPPPPPDPDLVPWLDRAPRRRRRAGLARSARP